MTSLDSLLERQVYLHGVIARSVENLKKIGPSKTTRGTVLSRIEALKANWSKFQDIYEGLVKSCSAEQKKSSYFSEDFHAQCEEAFIEVHGFLLDVLEQITQRDNPTSDGNESALNSSQFSRSRRLPRIDIPKFSGEYTQWNHFRDLFVSIIIENLDISAVEKLHYLKMSLSGEPSQLLKNISIAGENFTRAWETLVARYENKRILIDAQLAALFATQKINENAADLKRLLGDVNQESLKRWEETLSARSTSAVFADFENFLIGRIHTLEALERSIPRKQQQPASTTSRISGARAYTTTAMEQKCALCEAGHYISSCPQYLEKSYEQRRELISSKHLCFNCLGPHQVKTCRNQKRCRTCRKQHHTTLHTPTSTSEAVNAAIPHTSTTQPANTHASTREEIQIFPAVNRKRANLPSHVDNQRVINRAPVLLATAIVTISSERGNSLQVRALIDQGSEVSFVSESVTQLLRLPRRAAAIPIRGIGAQRNGVSKGIVSFTIASRINTNVCFKLTALVLPKLTAYLPPAQLEYTQWPHIHNLSLADPTFATPGKIDLILGADIYAQIIEEGLCRGEEGEPIAQNTALGWILSGPLRFLPGENAFRNCAVTGMQCSLDSELLDSLQRFWAQEEISLCSQESLNPEDAHCEEHFNATHTRDAHGRFVVRLPLKRSVQTFGDSCSAAIKGLIQLEKRFQGNTALKSAYSHFLREYLELDHMRLVNSADRTSQREFFLPHHDVVRETSSTTKLRVVFNGSQKTTLGF